MSGENIVTVNPSATNLVAPNVVTNLITVTSGSISTASTSRRYVHQQTSPSTTWTIEHSLGGRPSITIVDSSGTVVFGEVQYVSDTVITVTFSAEFAGAAYLT